LRRPSSRPLIRTQLKSKDFSAEATVLLEEKFAPRTNIHATLVDIKGVGVLMRGASGVRQERVRPRPHRARPLAGSRTITSSSRSSATASCRAPPRSSTAVTWSAAASASSTSPRSSASVRCGREKRVDLVVTFVLWQPGVDEERSGLEVETFEILGRKVPHMTIPVRPGRDMARLVEVAASVQALRGMGHDSAKEFSDRLIQFMAKGKAGEACVASPSVPTAVGHHAEADFAEVEQRGFEVVRRFGGRQADGGGQALAREADRIIDGREARFMCTSARGRSPVSVALIAMTI
jgi:HPr kinase/phosphorylase